MTARMMADMLGWLVLAESCACLAALAWEEVRRRREARRMGRLWRRMEGWTPRWRRAAEGRKSAVDGFIARAARGADGAGRVPDWETGWMPGEERGDGDGR